MKQAIVLNDLIQSISSSVIFTVNNFDKGIKRGKILEETAIYINKLYNIVNEITNE